MLRKEPEASLLKEGLEAYASGKIISVRELRDFWNKKGLRSQTGESKGSAKGMSVSNVGRILNQLVYAGYIEYQKTTKDANGAMLWHWNVPLRKGKHEGLISLETYNIIQEKLNNKKPVMGNFSSLYDEHFPLK